MSTPEPPVSLRVRLNDLQAELDDAAGAHMAHRREHGCREGACEEGRRLAERTGQAQHQLGVTRFLNDDE